MRELKFGLFDVVASGSFGGDRASRATLEDVFFGAGDVCEDFRGEVEVFGEHGFGCVCLPLSVVMLHGERGRTKPVSQQESRLL